MLESSILFASSKKATKRRQCNSKKDKPCKRSNARPINNLQQQSQVQSQEEQEWLPLSASYFMLPTLSYSTPHNLSLHFLPNALLFKEMLSSNDTNTNNDKAFINQIEQCHLCSSSSYFSSFSTYQMSDKKEECETTATLLINLKCDSKEQKQISINNPLQIFAQIVTS